MPLSLCAAQEGGVAFYFLAPHDLTAVYVPAPHPVQDLICPSNFPIFDALLHIVALQTTVQLRLCHYHLRQIPSTTATFQRRRLHASISALPALTHQPSSDVSFASSTNHRMSHHLSRLLLHPPMNPLFFHISSVSQKSVTNIGFLFSAALSTYYHFLFNSKSREQSPVLMSPTTILSNL